MKKAIILIALMAISLVSLGQAKTDTIAKQSGTAIGHAKLNPTKSGSAADAQVVYKADPAKVYQLQVTADQLAGLLETSRQGVVPYLKSVKLTMDKLDEADSYFTNLRLQLVSQYRKQYLADSLASIKPVKRK